ncbi:phage protein [Eubacteriales bacterium]|nr:DUF2577 domain-containing protein [Oscillospiraceae bacterium]MBS1380696.1 DUF2577 domain-containing protein [Oscillospiraceae bacterium]GKH49061.1 phage protein [Eubacteriales bacterium]GKH61702.1 phage protein [Eubacteriales bacterium]
MNELTQAVREAAMTAVEATKPADFFFGVVTASNPVAVLVDSRFTVSGNMLVIPREYRAGVYVTHTHTIDPHKHTIPTGESGETELTTKAETETYSGLAVGDKVVLLRKAGGQRFLILGRL